MSEGVDDSRVGWRGHRAPSFGIQETPLEIQWGGLSEPNGMRRPLRPSDQTFWITWSAEWLIFLSMGILNWLICPNEHIQMKSVIGNSFSLEWEFTCSLICKCRDWQGQGHQVEWKRQMNLQTLGTAGWVELPTKRKILENSGLQKKLFMKEGTAVDWSICHNPLQLWNMHRIDAIHEESWQYYRIVLQPAAWLGRYMMSSTQRITDHSGENMDWIRTLLRRGMYWVVHPWRPRDFPRPERCPKGEAWGTSLLWAV